MHTNSTRQRITRTDKPARSSSATSYPKPRKGWKRTDKRATL